MSRALCVIAMAMLVGGADCARKTVSCPEGTAIPDFESGGRECVPVGSRRGSRRDRRDGKPRMRGRP